MTLIYLVRHGVTAHTGHRLSGRLPGVHMTEAGRSQAEAAAGSLASIPLKAVYSSPLERCWETAEIVAARHERMRVRKATGLLEVDYGRWANRTFTALRRTALWRTVQKWPSGAEFPDGETIRRVQVRAVEEIESLRSKHPRERICCVSHADVIKLVVAHYLGVHVDLYQRIVVEPGSISILGIGEEGPVLLALNTFGRIGRA